MLMKAEGSWGGDLSFEAEAALLACQAYRDGRGLQ
jgi:hypothetical protein